MDIKLPSLQALVRTIQQVPAISPRHIHKVAHFFLTMNTLEREQFCQTIMTSCKNLEECVTCCSWKEVSGTCLFCDDPKRDKTIICIVETWHDLCSIERTNSFNGVYHVLGGSLNPLEGISPEDLTLMTLKQRVLAGGCKELILAMNQTPEGEATTAFIAHMLKECSLNMTCLARGLPVGGSLEFMDKLTVHKALTERRAF
ncbi:MAG: Recombination protein RecR [candidate division TM6 bacterium GW2011_GWE2_41_16]|nr:MAG: Recombination protein RecR [candidate division TM6 bacterium GW2011_GWE2_41_16]